MQIFNPNNQAQQSVQEDMLRQLAEPEQQVVKEQPTQPPTAPQQVQQQPNPLGMDFQMQMAKGQAMKDMLGPGDKFKIQIQDATQYFEARKTYSEGINKIQELEKEHWNNKVAKHHTLMSEVNARNAAITEQARNVVGTPLLDPTAGTVLTPYGIRTKAIPINLSNPPKFTIPDAPLNVTDKTTLEYTKNKPSAPRKNWKKDDPAADLTATQGAHADGSGKPTNLTETTFVKLMLYNKNGEYMRGTSTASEGTDMPPQEFTSSIISDIAEANETIEYTDNRGNKIAKPFKDVYSFALSKFVPAKGSENSDSWGADATANADNYTAMVLYGNLVNTNSKGIASSRILLTAPTSGGQTSEETTIENSGGEVVEGADELTPNKNNKLTTRAKIARQSVRVYVTKTKAGKPMMYSVDGQSQHSYTMSENTLKTLWDAGSLAHHGFSNLETWKQSLRNVNSNLGVKSVNGKTVVLVPLSYISVDRLQQQPGKRESMRHITAMYIKRGDYYGAAIGAYRQKHPGSNAVKNYYLGDAHKIMWNL